MARIKKNDVAYILVKDNMILKKFKDERVLSIYADEMNIKEYEVIIQKVS